MQSQHPILATLGSTYTIHINDKNQWNLREIVNPKENAKLIELNFRMDRRCFKLYPATNEYFELFGPDISNEKIKRVKFTAFSLDKLYSEFRVELSFTKNNTKKIYAFRSQNDFAACDAWMVSNGVFNSYSFKEFNFKVKSSDWDRQPIENIYGEIDYNTYKIIFDKVATTLNDILSKEKEYDNILLISPACGAADDLTAMRQLLNEPYKSKLIEAGFDFNAKNIARAKARLPEAYFEHCSLDNISNFIRNVNSKFVSSNRNEPTKICKIIFFSGVLAEDVVESPVAALKYLQMVIREKNNYIITASASRAYINTNIAKAAGLNVVKILPCGYYLIDYQPKIRVPISFYTEQTPEERVNYLVNRANKRKVSFNNMDLSFSANPLQDLNLLQQFAKEALFSATQLDLSWSYINESEIPKIAEILQTCKFDQVVIGPNDLGWAKQLKSLLLPKEIKFSIRKDTLNEYTLPYASIPENRRHGLFTPSLPTERVLNEEQNNKNMKKKP